MAQNSLIQTPPITTTDIPRTPLSKSDIAEPFNNLARGLDAMGEGVNDLAVPMAEKEARDAVRTDDNGNLVVDRAPLIMGPAGTAYSRSVQMTTLAKIQPEIDKSMLDMRFANRFDPNGYQTASQAYIKGLGDRFSSTPELSNAIQHSAQESFVHNYRTVLTETDQHQTQEALQAYQARLSDLNDQAAALARQGGTDTPEYQKGAAARAALWNELVADPRFKFSQDRANLEVNEAYSNDQVQAVIGDTVRTFQTRANKGEAQKYLTEKLWDPKLTLSPQKREYGISEGLRALEIVDAEDKERLSDNRRMVSTYVQNLQRDPSTYDEGMHNNMLQKSQELGDYKSLADLEAGKSFLPIWQTLKEMPPGQAAQTMQQLSAGVVPSSRFDAIIDREAKRANLDPNVVRRIIQIESGGRPNAQTGSYSGLMQLSGSEFSKYGGTGNILDPEQNIIAGVNSLADKSQRFADAHGGRAPSATELYLMHQQGEAGAAAHFAHPDQPAWQSMLSTAEGRQKGEGWAKQAIWGNIPADMRRQFPGGVDSVTSRDFVNIWQQKVEGAPIAGSHVDIFSDSPTGRLWESTVQNYRTRVGAVADNMASSIITRVDRGDGVPQQQQNDFANTAVAAGRQDLIDKVQPKIQALDAANSLPPGTSLDAFNAQVDAAKASGVGNAEYQLLENTQKLVNESARRMQTEPLVEGARKHYFDPIQALDPSSPQQVANELADRQKKAVIVQQQDPNHGAVNVLGGSESAHLANVLTRGDPTQSAQLLNGFQQSLQPGEYSATLGSETMKKAVTDMAGSGDPIRMGAAMSAMSAMAQNDPVAFRQAYGEEGSKELHGWMALRGKMTDAEIAQRIKDMNDPRNHEMMSKIAEAADKEVKFDPQAVANKLGSWADRWIPFVNAPAPLDSRQGQLMVDDFHDTYVALRQMGADKDSASQQAVQRLAETWRISPTNGNRFMQNAPEAQTFNGKPYYPMVNGSYQWMTDQLQSAIDAKYGRRNIPAVAGELPGASSAGDNWIPNATLYGLVADNQTEAERARGDPANPPSYQAIVKLASDGRIEALSGPDGMPARLRWNLPVAQAMALPAAQGAVDYWARAKPIIDAIGRSAAPTGNPEGPTREEELAGLDRREGALRALMDRGWGGQFARQQLGAIRDRRRALGGNIEEGPSFPRGQ